MNETSEARRPGAGARREGALEARREDILKIVSIQSGDRRAAGKVPGIPLLHSW